LDEITVGRVDLIARLVRRVQEAVVTGARPHTLIVGPRGSGKTHLLGVVLYRARLDSSVDNRLALALVPEDALSIGSYEDLLVEVARALAGPNGSLGERARTLRRSRDVPGLERLLLETANDRLLCLALENLDRIFAAIGSSGQAALRGFVETSAQVLLFASTPLLFAGVSSRDRPWYGSFDAEHLGDLPLAEGTELLTRAANDADNADLASYIASTRGQARLKAVEHLAGGSPRLWHILSGCVTIETLDQLVPSVEAMLDELAPYYQQRLWELPASEQKLVVELARQSGAQKVTELAAATGIQERAAATALGRLADSRWVRGTKVPGTDRRTTWYELREPLLRHHLQYRDAHGEPLRLIVEILHSWYSYSERRRYLAMAEPSSVAERHLVSTFVADPPARSDEPWLERDSDELLVEARLWMQGGEREGRIAGSSALGSAIEAIVLTARACTGAGASSGPMQRRSGFATLDEMVATAVRNQGGDLSDRVGAGLRALITTPHSAHDADMLLLLSSCWDGRANPQAARDQLSAMIDRRAGLNDRLTMIARAEHAFWVGDAGDAAAARDVFAVLVEQQTRVLGADDRDTLSSRHNHAFWVGQAGDAVAARDRFRGLVEDRVRVLGVDHRDTLSSRHNHAFWVGQAGDAVAARDLFAGVVEDLLRVLGVDHRDTLSSRYTHAYWVERAGDAAAARELFGALAEDTVSALGADDQLTAHCVREWLAMTLADDGLDRVRQALGGERFIKATTDVLMSREYPTETIERVVEGWPTGTSHVVALATVVLAQGARSHGWRRAVASQAAKASPGRDGELLELLGDAFGDDVTALARLPAELRIIVDELKLIDHGAATKL